MRRRRLLAALAGGATWAVMHVSMVRAATASPTPYSQRQEVRAFIDQLVAEHDLPRAWVEQVLDHGRYSALAERLNTPGKQPAAQRNWTAYRARHVDAARIEQGAAFARQHAAALARAQEQFGIPPAIIVAIIGIESHYGRLQGKVRTLDALVTLAFDYPRRAALYREQLAQFLVLAHMGQLDALEQRGSFAGAIGLPQFMPASLRHYALDFDADGRIDLAASPTDAIGSVGHFLQAHGWERAVPIQWEAHGDPEVLRGWAGGVEAAHRWEQLAAAGVRIDTDLPGATRVLLIDLPSLPINGEPQTEFRLGSVNFAALLRYNRSYFYAAAVADLAWSIERAAQTPRPTGG